jgi:hypothetical protein
LNGSFILFDMNIDYGSSTTYHKKNDVIKKDVTEPLEWISFPNQLVDIASTAEGTWPNEWTISNNKIQDFYYVGIRVQAAGGEQVGWLKFTIDNKSGAIIIVDKELTTASSISITRELCKSRRLLTSESSEDTDISIFESNKNGSYKPACEQACFNYPYNCFQAFA